MTASGWLELEEDRAQQEDQIRNEVQTIRDYLLACGFEVDSVFEERREGLIYSACYRFPGQTLREALEVYLRVSMYMQTKGHSLGTQLDMALRKAAQEGRTIARVWLDAGITGRDDKRPAFSRMMGLLVHDGSRGLIVYDLYRFYRNLQGLLNHYQRLDEAGVTLWSLADSGVDFGSNTGKILLTMKGLLGEMMLDDLSRTTRDNKLSRARKGLSNASLPPFGYCTGRCYRCTDNNGPGYCPRAGHMPDLRDELDAEEGVFVPHPIESAAVSLTFDWYGTGEFSDRQIAVLLNEHVHHLVDGTPIRFRPKGRHGHMEEERTFGKDSVRDLLQNPYYAGLVVYQRSSKGLSKADDAGSQRVLFGGKHLPLVSMNAIETALEVRAALRHLPWPGGARRPAAVRGLEPRAGQVRLSAAHRAGRGAGRAGRGHHEGDLHPGRVGGDHRGTFAGRSEMGGAAPRAADAADPLADLAGDAPARRHARRRLSALQKALRAAVGPTDAGSPARPGGHRGDVGRFWSHLGRGNARTAQAAGGLRLCRHLCPGRRDHPLRGARAVPNSIPRRSARSRRLIMRIGHRRGHHQLTHRLADLAAPGQR